MSTNGTLPPVLARLREGISLLALAVALVAPGTAQAASGTYTDGEVGTAGATSSSTLTVNGTDAATETGAITSTLTKAGTGTLTLTGNSSFGHSGSNSINITPARSR